jgi:hypothetical protein
MTKNATLTPNNSVAWSDEANSFNSVRIWYYMIYQNDI